MPFHQLSIIDKLDYISLDIRCTSFHIGLFVSIKLPPVATLFKIVFLVDALRIELSTFLCYEVTARFNQPIVDLHPYLNLVLDVRVELTTYPLSRDCSTTELIENGGR